MSLIKKILLFVVLFLPVSLYYFLKTTGKNHYKTLAIFGPKIPIPNKIQPNGKVDTLYHTLKGVGFYNQFGELVGLEQNKSPITLFSFFGSENDQTNRVMESLVDWYKSVDGLKFISITAHQDPKTYLPILQKSALKYHADPKRWELLVTNPDNLALLAQESFLLKCPVNNFSIDQKCFQTLILMDSFHRIRGFYNALDPYQVKNLKGEIRVLMVQNFKRKKKS